MKWREKRFAKAEALIESNDELRIHLDVDELQSIYILLSSPLLTFHSLMKNTVIKCFDSKSLSMLLSWCRIAKTDGDSESVFIRACIYLFIIYFYLFFYLFIYLFIIYLFILFIYLAIYLFIYWRFIYLFIHLFIISFIYPIYLFDSFLFLTSFISSFAYRISSPFHLFLISYAHLPF